MLEKNKIIAFIPTKNPLEARRFYEGILGLKFVEEDPFALVMEAHGTKIRIAKTEDFKPAPFTILGWEVPNLEAILKQLKEKQVPIMKYDFLVQDGLGVWTAPGGAKVAWFQDPDGNVLSLSQN